MGVFSTWMKTERAQRGAARRSKVVAARMVLLCAFARAVKLQRCGGTARVPAKLLVPEVLADCGGAGRSL